MLEQKRDDIVRSTILQMHTAVEDLLNSLIIFRMLGVKAEERAAKMRSNAGRALRKMLFGAGSLGFEMKLNFAVALGLLPMSTKENLMELNTLRNKCSHNWLLKMPVRRGQRPKQTKPPLLSYRGHDLHTVAAIKEFSGEYGSIYFKLLGALLD
jgi:hypothetical protein